MFYIHILNQPPYNKSNFNASHSDTEPEQKSLMRCHQIEVKKIHQNIRENYHLERHFFI